jgi:uncharacterized lipoprotein YmbA
MSRGFFFALLLCGASGAAVGCGSSPPSSFYALSAQRGAVQPAPFHIIKLRRPGIAGYLDRPEIVKRIVDHRLGVTDTDRWAAPLDEMLGRILAQDVEQRLAGSVVFTEDGAITADADVTVEIDVRELDVDEAGQVGLVAEVAVERGADHTVSGARVVRIRHRPSAASTPAMVGAMSDALGDLADEVSGLLRSDAAATTARNGAAATMPASR